MSTVETNGTAQKHSEHALTETARRLLAACYHNPDHITVVAGENPVMPTASTLVLWDHMTEVSGPDGFDPARVSSRLTGTDGEAEAKAKSLLQRIRQNDILGPVEAASFGHKGKQLREWARQLAEHATKERLAMRLGRIASRIDESGPDLSLETIRSEVIADVQDVTSEVDSQGLRHVSEFLEQAKQDTRDWEEGRMTDYLPTGFYGLDKEITGIPVGELTIFAAPSGAGKTSWLLQLLRQVAVRDANEAVCFFSIEMPASKVVHRAAAAWKGASLNQVRENPTAVTEAGDTFAERHRRALSALEDVPLFIDSDPEPTLGEIYSRVMQVQAEHDVILVGVDYDEKVDPEHDGHREEQRVASISKGLKTLAKETDTACVALSQYNSKPSAMVRPGSNDDLRYCLPSGTEIRRADGSKCKIEDVQDGDRLLTLNDDWKLQKSQPVESWEVPAKQTYRLKTRTGREIVASGNHPFLTPDGWTRLDALTEKTPLAIPRRIPSNSQPELSENEMRLLGYLIGDGGYKEHRSVTFTNSEKAILDDFREIATAVFQPPTERHIEGKDAWQLRLTQPGSYFNGTGRSDNDTIRWLQTLGVHGQESSTKRIPRAAFGSDGISELLSGMILADGSIGRTRGGWMIRYYTNSKGLAHDYMSALLQLGVVSSMRRKDQGRHNPLYVIHVSHGEGVARLLSHLNLVGKKGQKAAIARDELGGRQKRPCSLDRLPRAALAPLKRYKKQQGLTYKELGYRIQNSRITRHRAEEVAEKIDCPAFSRWANSDIIWDEVESITQEGKKELYDIRVPGTANFVANDLIVHNSRKKKHEAHTILHWYWPAYWLRSGDVDLEEGDEMPPHYNPQNEQRGRLYVGKDRDGGPGWVPLDFHAERTRFIDPADPEYDSDNHPF